MNAPQGHPPQSPPPPGALLKINSASHPQPNRVKSTLKRCNPPQSHGLGPITHQPDLFAAFPTEGRIVSDVMLKEMLHSFRSSLQADIMGWMQQYRQEVHNLGDRVNTVESSLSKHTLSFNTRVDAHNQHSDEILWFKDKVADLEDRSRRNNLKLRSTRICTDTTTRTICHTATFHACPNTVRNRSDN